MKLIAGEAPYSRRHGLVSATVVVGVSEVKEFLAGFSNFFGTRAKGLEKETEKAKSLVLEKLVLQAENTGADAVINVRLFPFVIPLSDGFLIGVSGYGDAVFL